MSRAVQPFVKLGNNAGFICEGGHSLTVGVGAQVSFARKNGYYSRWRCRACLADGTSRSEIDKAFRDYMGPEWFGS